MKLDNDMQGQVKALLAHLKSPFTLLTHADLSTERGRDVLEFVNSLAECSEHLTVQAEETALAADFTLLRDGKPLGITFKGVPGGHEFNTLLLALLNADGVGRNLPDEAVQTRIRALRGPADLRTFVSLSCTNCPDVAQALNVVALLNEGYSNTVIDGGQWPEEAEAAGVQAVPTVYADGSLLSVGRATLSDLVALLEKQYGRDDSGVREERIHRSDVLILGGGPGGAAAAIYAARKGQKVAVVAADPGGSVTLTGDIENLITTRLTTGAELAKTLRDNMVHYGVSLFADRRAARVEVKDAMKTVVTDDGERFEAPQLIVATGSRPRRLGVPGEEQYTGKGVAYCPHCDGPFFKGRDVIVVGGGNSGIEAAIDLAGICRKVWVVEFADRPLADEVLIKAAEALPNVEISVGMQVTEILGDGSKATAVRVKDRATGEEKEVPTGGVFVQIGVLPNSELFDGVLKTNRRGEIETDREMRTSEPDVYAVGDVCDAPYNQIVTAIGQGAVAALSAFADKIRGV